MWATISSVPSGFLLCDGTAVSRTTYSALFSVIGGLYGNGNNVSTFNLPNFTGRMPIGANASYVVGSSGGNANAAVISHSHSVSASATTSGQSQTHSHVVSGNTAGVGNHLHGNFEAAGFDVNGGGSPSPQRLDFGDNNPYAGITRDMAGGAHDHSFSVTSGNSSVDHTHSITLSGNTSIAGESGIGANLPPYLGINFIIKI
jgi:microcystin-dependent protein